MERPLNKRQNKAYVAMMQGLNVFITGCGGVGKTHLINYFRETCGRKVGVTSTTGVSAVLLNGTTIHSWSGILFGKGTPQEIYKTMNVKAKNRWRSVCTLIIDEISMMPADLFIKLECVARLVRRNSKPFGGIQVILVGDFAQLPPIEGNKFCFELDLWKDLIDVSIHLKKIVRQKNKQFQKLLTEARYGSLSENSKMILRSRKVKGKLPKKNGIEPTMLYAKNIDVRKKNALEIKKLKKAGKKSQKYYSYTQVYTDTPLSDRYEKSLKDKLNANCPALDVLELTIDSQVMILKNLDIENGIANGTRGVVVDLDPNSVLLQLLDGRKIKIEKDNWESRVDETIYVQKSQLPLVPAWSLSIHKTQGSTLDLVAMDLGNSIFEYGQAYVALSRVRELEGLYLTELKTKRIQCHPKVKEFYEKMN